MVMASTSAFVVGYTGATGKELVKELAACKRFARVVLIGRRKVEFESPELQAMEQRVVDFEKLEDYKDELSGIDVGFCCLGTTRHDAGSAEAFRRVDFDYVHEVARYSKEGGTKHFHYVSSTGADKDSRFLYAKTKGQIEHALTELMFDRLSIYRPKLLGRENPRVAERVFSALCKPIGLIKPSIVYSPCDLVAKAIVRNCDASASSATEILYNDDIYRLGGYYDKKNSS